MTPYCSSIINALPSQARHQASNWIRGNQVSEDFVTIFSQETANLRYRFSPQEAEIIQMIFNKAIEADSLLLKEGNTGFFSKKEIQIAFLRGIGIGLTFPVIKACLCFCAALNSYQMARSAYKWTEHAIAAHAVPFIVNRTSVNTVRIFNSLMNNAIYYKNFISSYSSYLVICVFFGRYFSSLLPATVGQSKLSSYIGLVAKTAQRIIFFLSPVSQSNLVFCLSTAWDGVSFAWRGSQAVGQILLEMADKLTHSEREKIKEEQFQRWQKEILAFRKANEMETVAR